MISLASWATAKAPLEFKQRVRSDQRTGSSDKPLESVVAKTVAGFMNAHGGTLVIGVDDNGNPVGLDRDWPRCQT